MEGNECHFYLRHGEVGRETSNRTRPSARGSTLHLKPPVEYPSMSRGRITWVGRCNDAEQSGL